MSDRWEWDDADGVRHQISNGSEGIVELADSRAGTLAPTTRRARDFIVQRPGSLLRSVLHDTRQPELHVFMSAATPAAFEARWDGWVRQFDPARGDGQLRHVRHDGTVRTLTCVCVDGLAPGQGNRGPEWLETVLVFEAGDPYWYDDADVSVRFAGEGASGAWFDPGVSKFWLPVTLGSSTVLGATSLDVDTDVPVVPTWTVTGPGTELELRHVTSDRLLAWSGTLAGGETLIIDGGLVPMVSVGGVNVFDELTSFDLWSLLPGANDVEVVMSDTTAASSVVMSYRPARLGC